MTIKEFLRRLKNHLEQIDLKSHSSTLIFFNCLFYESFEEAIDEIPGIPQNWRELNFETKDDWENIYFVAANVLWDAACRNSSEVHPDIFQEATAISVAFSHVLKESLGIEIDSIEIQSPVDMMLRGGLLKIQEESEGKRYVRLSEEGERMVKEGEEE